MYKISKNIILTYTKALRTIQNEQIDPYIKLIEDELIKLHPELKDREDNASNWAINIFKTKSNAEVVSILERLDSIIHEERASKWICRFCGKNTYNDDSEYLFGTNHISCALEDDIKNRSHSDPDYILNSNPTNQKINELESELRNTKKTIVNLELQLEHLRRDYPHKPTN